MGIVDIFSKRQKRLRGEIPDVYTYTNIPDKLKAQVVHIIIDAIDTNMSDCFQGIYQYVFDTLCREYGKFSLTNDNSNTIREQILNFLLQTHQTEEILDVIEVTFGCIDKNIRDILDKYTTTGEITIEDQYEYSVKKEDFDKAIEELNRRFKENGVGYSFESGQIIKIDSTYVHSEITKPTIALLGNNKFMGANEEYLKAHEYYRHGGNKECLTECAKAFESTMKIICKEKGWTYNQTDTVQALIRICFNKDLIPSFIQNQFTSLQSLLKSGIPTIRNKVGAHGQGQVPQKVDDEITRYGLNLTGANIIFLIEQSRII